MTSARREHKLDNRSSTRTSQSYAERSRLEALTPHTTSRRRAKYRVKAATRLALERKEYRTSGRSARTTCINRRKKPTTSHRPFLLRVTTFTPDFSSTG